MATAVSSVEPAKVLLAKDDQIIGDVLKAFRDRMVGHPQVTTASLDSFASPSPSCCTSMTLPSGLSDHDARIDTPDSAIGWADLFVVVLGANTLAKMLHGITDDSFLLKTLRSWDVSKKILLVPFMSKNAWENPMTRKQLSKIRRKWKWIRVLEEPIISSSIGCTEEALTRWPGMDNVVNTIQNQADMLIMGHNLVIEQGKSGPTNMCEQRPKANLPFEIWSMILEYVQDWELAQALGIHTKLGVPYEWNKLVPRKCSTLEWTILKGRLADFVFRLPANDPPRWLSCMCVKLIVRFARIDIVEYLEVNHKDLFWSAFGHELLPVKASAVFPRTEVLSWWNKSVSFLTKEYTAEAIDGASKHGYVHILEWWRASGLPLQYTEAALEQAGDIEVLEWWRSVSKLSHSNQKPLQLKVGKALLFAAHHGLADFIRWWAGSGISTGHEDAVARTASTNGHVNVLQQRKACKGDKMQFDNQILVGPTKNSHVHVMEWWKNSGYQVEYKTCDIEEALEDSSGESIHTWWARNGLNLGMGTRMDENQGSLRRDVI